MRFWLFYNLVLNTGLYSCYSNTLKTWKKCHKISLKQCPHKGFKVSFDNHYMFYFFYDSLLKIVKPIKQKISSLLKQMLLGEIKMRTSSGDKHICSLYAMSPILKSLSSRRALYWRKPFYDVTFLCGSISVLSQEG